MSLDSVVEVLRAHPWVGGVRADDDGVRVTADPAALVAGAHPGPLVAEFLDQWSEVYDATYRAAGGRHAEDLDLSGWRATDTGRPLPTGHMRQWLDHTVDLILGARPRHVLELGCGTGLLLHRLRPHVAGYVGTDVAPHAVSTLNADAPPHVRVVTAAAHELTGNVVRAALADLRFPDGRPDCVLLNSVTQCFPDVAYLTYVLGAAVELVAPGGTVFVGDVRHAGLHQHFCRWAERAATADAADTDLARRAQQRAERDEELLVDPATVAAAALGVTGRNVRVAVHAKTMQEDSELTRYRYDLVLHVDPPAAHPTATEIAWTDLPATDRPAALRQAATGAVRIRGVRNALLHPRDPDAVTAHHLWATVGGRAAVLLDPHEPGLLEVASPRVATRPAAEVAVGVRRAHEPLPGYVRRRLAEEARRLLRRRLPAAAGVRVTVDLPEVAR
ncbi:class I SAM-dependent methyltransferase [Micromonospora sp. NPDC023633]|uniref:class I SAM-dependent methyltransferase n=1 Tax=Micromonospora sp. NPDC023633 TaxID=3154320 RepID=UPI0034064AA6